MEGARSQLLASLFDKKTIEILKKLLLKKDIFYLRDLSRETGVSLATTFRIVQKLMSLGLVTKEQQDKFTWYKLLRDTDIYREVYSLVMGATPDPADMFKQQLKGRFAAAFQAYMTRDKDKKIFVISDMVKQADADAIISSVTETTGTKLNCMVITPAFFEQMQTIGMIAKEKLASL
ncbi:MAG: helix-turn-helix domain-containing protein [archaeon]